MDRLVLLRPRRAGFGFRNHKVEEKKPPLSRDEQICELRAAGRTFVSIAGEFGLSHVRVMQICKKGEVRMAFNCPDCGLPLAGPAKECPRCAAPEPVSEPVSEPEPVSEAEE